METKEKHLINRSDKRDFANAGLIDNVLYFIIGPKKKKIGIYVFNFIFNLTMKKP